MDFVNGISPDGSTVYGQERNNNNLIRWNKTTGYQDIAPPAGVKRVFPQFVVEQTGEVIGQGELDSGGFVPFRYTDTGGFNLLPAPPDAERFVPTDATPDGGTVLGFFQNSDQVVTYDTANGYQALNLTEPTSRPRPVGISADGTKVLLDKPGAIWTEGEGISFLPDIVVESRHFGSNTSGFDTTDEFSRPAVLSNDGAWVAGGINEGDDFPGAVWNEQLGTIYLFDLLEMAGLSSARPTVDSVEPKWPFDNYISGLTLDGDILTISGKIGADQGFGGFVAQIDLNTIPGIPEPGSLALLSLGGAALLLRRRRNMNRGI